MKRSTNKKLTIAATSIRVLTGPHLEGVHGGGGRGTTEHTKGCGPSQGCGGGGGTSCPKPTKINLTV